MRHSLDATRFEQRLNERKVRPVRLEERLANALAQFGDMAVDVEAEVLEHDPPCQRIAVRVQSGGRNADEQIANGNRAAVDQSLAIDDANDKAGEIEIG